MGFGSLSNYTRFLLTRELARARGEKSYKLNEDSIPGGYGQHPPAEKSLSGYHTGY